MIIKGLSCLIIAINLFVNDISIMNKFDELVFVKENYYAKLSIPKIDLEQILYPKEDIRNDIDSNIIFVDGSNLPNEKNGNVVIAGHSGSTTVSYFKYLYKLEEGDIIYLEYDNTLYEYKVDKRYLVDKIGTVDIIKDKNKSTLTLVTCSGKEKQLVLVANLIKQTKK